MFVEAENRLFDGGGRRGWIEELCVVTLVGLKTGGLREVDDTGLAPSTFRLESVGRVADLIEIMGVDGKDVDCVTGGVDVVGVVT